MAVPHSGFVHRTQGFRSQVGVHWRVLGRSRLISLVNKTGFAGSVPACSYALPFGCSCSPTACKSRHRPPLPLRSSIKRGWLPAPPARPNQEKRRGPTVRPAFRPPPSVEFCNHHQDRGSVPQERPRVCGGTFKRDRRAKTGGVILTASQYSRPLHCFRAGPPRSDSTMPVRRPWRG